jgi:hypothetical protein
VTDARGRRQGVIGGHVVSEIPGGHVIRLIGGIPGAEAEPLEHVPAGTDVTLRVDGSSLEREATGVGVSEIGPGFVVAARGIDVRPGATSSLAVRGDGTSFTYASGPDAATARPRFELARTTAEGDYRVEIDGAAVPAGARITATLDPATLAVSVAAEGMSATDFRVAVTRRDPSGGRAVATAPAAPDGRAIGLDVRLPRLIAAVRLSTHRVSRRGAQLSYVDSRPGGRVAILTQRAVERRCGGGRRCVGWVRVRRVEHADLARRVSVRVGALLPRGRYRVAVVVGVRKTGWLGFTVR